MVEAGIDGVLQQWGIFGFPATDDQAVGLDAVYGTRECVCHGLSVHQN